MKLSPFALAGALLLAQLPQAFAQSGQCAADAPMQLLLVDQSDVFDDVDRVRIADGVSKMISGLPGGVRLDVFAITNRPGSLTPALQACAPACGGAGQIECGDALYLRHRQSFNGQVQRTISAFIQNAQPLDESEILRSLYWLSREYEGRNVSVVTMFSDLIEYSSLNRTVTNFNIGTADNLLATVRKKLPPGKAFAKAQIKIFGYGKRLGSRLKEAEQAALREQISAIEATTSRKPGDKKLEKPKPETFELNDGNTRAFDYFWRRYFLDLAAAPQIDIRLSY